MMNRTSRWLGCAALMAVAGCVGRGGESDDELSGHVRTAANDDGCYPGALGAERALCLCDDLDQVGALYVTPATYGQPSSVGVNGRTSLVAGVDIAGDLVAYGGFDAVSGTIVHGDLSTARNFGFAGVQHVGGDLSVGGDVSGVGTLTVGGQLRVAGDVSIVGSRSVGGTGSYRPPAGPPCACDGERFFDAAVAVADARRHNDNASIGLPTDGSSAVGDTVLALPSGRYYLAGIEAVGSLHVRAVGHAALFIGGSLEVVGAQRFSVAPGGSLDLYVADQVVTVGDVIFGNAEDPMAFRLFVGTLGGAVVTVGAQAFHGYLYAPGADIDWVGDTEIVGGLVARQLVGVGTLRVRHGGAAATDEATCTPVRPEEGGGAGADAPPCGPG